MAAELPKTRLMRAYRSPWQRLTPVSGVTVFNFLFGSLASLCLLVFTAHLYSATSPTPSSSAIATQLEPAVGSVSAPGWGLRITTPTGPVICLGDSLTQGIGASQGHDYPALLSKTLGIEVINAGVDGDETADALRRLYTDVLAKDPRLVIVELGANDFLDGVPLKTAFANLEAIVQRIEAQGATVVLVGMAPGPLGGALQKDYNRIIQKYHVAFVPKVLDNIITDPRLKDSDRLHPNDWGYVLIAERIRRVVEPLLTYRKPS